ncbi:hypothetical protein LMG28688_00720 [Paraburkholderia caffeinitolerans]|uniref:Uncharacterized protein n=1 Tax=Paraburkholderia caffeinitolerans TaxID=1723730 RepID=A0A6J5FIG3_9BURK|nr:MULTISPECIES: hypothetical protein [Paraburkholderia]CAB3779099.1 hypothetical protein LMG28688_00720 [Paraburkholderia caffeinitolerans]
MNRRTFLHAASGAFAAACTVTLAWRPGAPPVRVAIYDPALEQGRALAGKAARMRVPAFALGAQCADDIGTLWHAQLARRLETRAVAPAVALCALRGSDRFVLERLAAPRGCIVLRA